MSWGSSGLAWADALSAPNTVTAYIDHVLDQDDGAADRLQPRIAAAIVDVFVYVVVLNLFVEYLPQVISETFTLSLLTAILLKGVLEIVVAAVLLWVVLFGSKFLVLEVVALVFRDRVSLGGFFSVTALILVLLVSRAVVRRLLQQPRSRAAS